MSRCHECSKVMIPKPHIDFSETRMRTWPSGPELIRLSEIGCDLCSFIRKNAERAFTTNLRRAIEKPAIVVRDCHGVIALSFCHSYNRLVMEVHIPSLEHRSYFEIELVSTDAPISVLRTPYDPVLHSCELFEACVLSDQGEHHNCGRFKTFTSAKVDQLPRRLLELSHDDYIVTLDVLTWINTSRATIDQLYNYCTLSYRWGQGPPDCFLSTRPIGDRILPLECLPKTFKDAIIVARALKIRFIWIDAMCIVQPSAHGDFTDWNVEGSRMWLVYQNAICNIAATCSSNPDDGFLSRAGTDYNAPCRIPAETKEGATQPMFLPEIPADSLYYRSVTMSSLNRRGWVAQERLLSRRILHFTEERVFWECQAVYTTGKVPIFDQLGDSSFGHSSLLTFRKWLLFIQFYSASSFTQMTDRLIALSSIARSVPAELFGTTYLAGIWGEHLIECLSWFSDDPCSVDLRRRNLAIAPSWSWASVPGKIWYPDADVYSTTQTLAKLEGGFTCLVQASKVYETIEEGELKFLARMSSMSLPTYNIQQEMFEDLDIEHVGWIKRSIIWDEKQDLGATESVYHIVPLRITRGQIYGTEHLISLVVASLPSTNDKSIEGLCEFYRRIGYFELDFYCEFDKEDQMYNVVDYDVLFDTVFPSATERSIIIV